MFTYNPRNPEIVTVKVTLQEFIKAFPDSFRLGQNVIYWDTINGEELTPHSVSKYLITFTDYNSFSRIDVNHQTLTIEIDLYDDPLFPKHQKFLSQMKIAGFNQ